MTADHKNDPHCTSCKKADTCQYKKPEVVIREIRVYACNTSAGSRWVTDQALGGDCGSRHFPTGKNS